MKKFTRPRNWFGMTIALLTAIAFGFASCNTSTNSGGEDTSAVTAYSITIASEIEHGKVSTDKTSAEEGATIKLTATPDDGYLLDTFSVKDASGNALTVVDGTFTMPKSNVVVSATFTTVSGIYTVNGAFYINVDAETLPASGNGAW